MVLVMNLTTLDAPLDRVQRLWSAVVVVIGFGRADFTKNSNVWHSVVSHSTNLGATRL